MLQVLLLWEPEERCIYSYSYLSSGLSQPIVWLTQYEVFPVVAVEGVGAVALPVPPVAVVYHNRFVPVAVSGTAVEFWQYVTGVVTVGRQRSRITVTVI